MEKMPSAEGRTPFKDYCQILQLHPDADAEMIDAAYWHLARRYSEALATDPTAKRRLDDLNEAYSVMRSAERREEYNKLREQVLGAGALPAPPEPEREPMPLSVLEKEVERLHAWTESAGAPISGPRGLPRITAQGLQTGVAAGLMLFLGIVSLTRAPDPALVAVILAIGLLVIAVPLYRRLPHSTLPALSMAKPSMPSMPALHRPPSAEPSRPKPPSVDADSLRAQTNAIRERLRGSAASASASASDSAARPRGAHGLLIVDRPDRAETPAADEDGGASGVSAA